MKVSDENRRIRIQDPDPLVRAMDGSPDHESGTLIEIHLDDKLPVVEGDVAYLGPGEADLGRELVVLLVDVEAERVHAQPQLRTLLVLDLEVVHAVHLQVLRVREGRTERWRERERENRLV